MKLQIDLYFKIVINSFVGLTFSNQLIDGNIELLIAILLIIKNISGDEKFHSTFDSIF